jgi:hypothetical protein
VGVFGCVHVVCVVDVCVCGVCVCMCVCGVWVCGVCVCGCVCMCVCVWCVRTHASVSLPAYFTMLLLTCINRHMEEEGYNGINQLMLHCTAAAGLFINKC